MNENSVYDELDELLSMLPGEVAGPDLAPRICRAIRARRRCIMQLHLGASGLLALLGIWLTVPDFVRWIGEIQLPASGLPWLFGLLEAVLMELELLVINLLRGILSVSTGFATSLGALTWLGLVALAIGAFLALPYLLPDARGD